MSATLNLVLAAMAVGAQDASPAGARSVEPIFECRSITDDRERLACYDAAVGAVAGQATGEVFVVDRARLEAVERDSFGLSVPSLPDLPSLFSREGELGLEANAPAPAAPASPSRAAAAPTQPEARVVERDDEGEIDRIELVISDVSLVGYETVVMEMTNGQVWRITRGSDRLVRRTQAGDIAEIRRAAAGSYLLRVNGDGRAWRAQRER